MNKSPVQDWTSTEKNTHDRHIALNILICNGLTLYKPCHHPTVMSDDNF